MLERGKRISRWDGTERGEILNNLKDEEKESRGGMEKKEVEF